MEIDYSDTQAIAKELFAKSEQLSDMVLRVAKARQVREFDSDRRKSALSRAVREVMKGNGDMSATAAEHSARALPSYEKDMAQIAQDLITAEGHIAEWECVKIGWETCRSVMSLQKSAMSNL